MWNNLMIIYKKAFDRAKTRFTAGCGYVSNVKIFCFLKKDDDIKNTIKELLNSEYDVIIYAVFYEQNLEDSSVAVYYRIRSWKI